MALVMITGVARSRPCLVSSSASFLDIAFLRGVTFTIRSGLGNRFGLQSSQLCFYKLLPLSLPISASSSLRLVTLRSRSKLQLSSQPPNSDMIPMLICTAAKRFL